MGIIILSPKSGRKLTDGEVKSFTSAIKMAEKAKEKNMPFTIMIEDMDVFCSPGSVNRIEPNDFGQIQINLNEDF